MKTCTKCGASSNDDLKFCGHCGGNLDPVAQKPRGRVNQFIPVALVFLVVGIVIGAFIGYSLSKTTENGQNTSQLLRNGDLITYTITINGEPSGYLSQHFYALNDSRIAVNVFSTCWYDSSINLTLNYYYENGSLKIPALWGDWVDNPSAYKVSETNLDTPYGMKQVCIYDYYESNANRATYSPSNCYFPFKYTINDSSGNHVVGILSYTNIGWLEDSG